MPEKRERHCGVIVAGTATRSAGGGMHSSSCKQRWTRRTPRTQGHDPRLRLYACFDGGSGRAHRLAAGAGAIGQGGLRQGHGKRRRNACLRVGLKRVHGLDAGGGACFRQSRAGTARANITHIIELGYWLYCALKFEYELCHSRQLARPAGY